MTKRWSSTRSGDGQTKSQASKSDRALAHLGLATNFRCDTCCDEGWIFDNEGVRYDIHTGERRIKPCPDCRRR